MLSALQRARKNGCEIISINPLPEAGLLAFQHPQQPLDLLGGAGTKLSTQFLSVKINGDVALLKAIMLAMLALEEKNGGVFAHEFIAQHTHGYQAFIEDLKRANGDELAEKCGISRAEIEQVAATIAQSKRVIACWAMGMTQHKNAVAGIQSIINLLLWAAISGAKERAPVRCAVIPTCRATAPWASGSAPKRSFWMLWAKNSVSSRRASTDTTWWKRSKRCTKAAPKFFLRWAAISFPPRPTPRSRRKRFVTVR
jgi:hypothetical protein